MSIGEYFMSVVASSVIAALVGMLCPDDKGGVKKSLEICISLFLLCVMIAPLGTLISDAKEKIDLDDIDLSLPKLDVTADAAILDSLAKASKAEIERILHDSVCERLEIDGADIALEADVTADADGVSIGRIVLRLYGSAMWRDPRSLREVIADYTDAECIIVNGG